MRKIYFILMTLYLAMFMIVAFWSCKEKKQPEPPIPVVDTIVEVCTFGIPEDKLIDTALAGQDSLMNLAKGKPPKPDPVPPINPDNPDNWPVFFIDFDGGFVTGTMWNWTDTIFYEPAGLDSTGMRLVVENVIEDFSYWYIRVTTSEAVFNAAPVSKRQKLIVTASTPLGVSSGQAMLNSFGTGNPAFVQTTYTVTRKKAKEAASHELGHTMGCRHQDFCDGTYSMGKIMGNGYYVEFPVWTKTPCQDDMGTIDKKLVRR